MFNEKKALFEKSLKQIVAITYRPLLTINAITYLIRFNLNNVFYQLNFHFIIIRCRGTSTCKTTTINYYTTINLIYKCNQHL